LEKVRYFLEEKDPSLALKEAQGLLPLHLSLARNSSLEVSKLIFDKHPAAVLVPNPLAGLPHEIAQTELNVVRQTKSWRAKECEKIFTFLETQHAYLSLVSVDSSTLVTPDENGYLLLHRALEDKTASLGTIESIVKGNNDALAMPDNKGMVPLHLACKHSALDVIQFLLSLDSSLVETVDNDGCNPLHHACIGGNLEAVSFLLGYCASLVGVENSKQFTCFVTKLERATLWIAKSTAMSFGSCSWHTPRLSCLAPPRG